VQFLTVLELSALAVLGGETCRCQRKHTWQPEVGMTAAQSLIEREK
jgi:hypothetical protein